jgi:hypothetical protein
MYADFMIWPWLERFDFLSKYRNFTLDESRLAKFGEYINRMRNVPACNKLAINAEHHEKFYESMLNSNEQAEYDHGL